MSFQLNDRVLIDGIICTVQAIHLDGRRWVVNENGDEFWAHEKSMSVYKPEPISKLLFKKVKNQNEKIKREVREAFNKRGMELQSMMDGHICRSDVFKPGYGHGYVSAYYRDMTIDVCWRSPVNGVWSTRETFKSILLIKNTYSIYCANRGQGQVCHGRITDLGETVDVLWADGSVSTKRMSYISVFAQGRSGMELAGYLHGATIQGAKADHNSVTIITSRGTISWEFEEDDYGGGHEVTLNMNSTKEEQNESQ